MLTQSQPRVVPGRQKALPMTLSLEALLLLVNRMQKHMFENWSFMEFGLFFSFRFLTLIFNWSNFLGTRRLQQWQLDDRYSFSVFAIAQLLIRLLEFIDRCLFLVLHGIIKYWCWTQNFFWLNNVFFVFLRWTILLENTTVFKEKVFWLFIVFNFGIVILDQSWIFIILFEIFVGLLAEQSLYLLIRWRLCLGFTNFLRIFAASWLLIILLLLLLVG